MQVPENADGRLELTVSESELVLINNALIEVWNGVAIEDFEFERGLGDSHEEMRSVLAGISKAHN